MLALKYKYPDENLSTVMDLLEQNCLAYTLALSHEEEEIVLCEGNNRITGVENILSHIQQIINELPLWHHYSC